MKNLILILIVAAIVAAALVFIIREKKKGRKCIGCPHAKNCAGGCKIK